MLDGHRDAQVDRAVEPSDPAMTVAFGEFEVDPAHFELRRLGRRIPLEPQAYDVLLYLVQHRDRVVSKEELMDAFCTKAYARRWHKLDHDRDDLVEVPEWEAHLDVLKSRSPLLHSCRFRRNHPSKQSLSLHCPRKSEACFNSVYFSRLNSATSSSFLSRLSACQTCLVPDLLKKT